MEYLLEIIGGLILMILGGLGWQVSVIKTDIRELYKTKADHEDMAELKVLMQQILDKVTDIQLEHARWQGRQESQEKMRQERS